MLHTHMVEILVSIVLPDIVRNVRYSAIFGKPISGVNFCTASTGLIQSQIEYHHKRRKIMSPDI